MIGVLDLGLRLTIWFLLTSDLSLVNILIGVTVALLIPRRYVASSVWQDGLRIGREILIAIPQAYWEAWQMILRPHTEEVVEMERVKPQRTPGLIFLDIFLITFTPKALVLKYHEAGWYEVHNVTRRRRP
ncbi:cation:proton antiporter [Synechocystis salina LEGE 06155]|nr:cation:proton antiporter [Synechocystis salina LEGE 06155]